MYRLLTKILLISFLFFVVPQMAQAGFLDDVAYCTGDGSCNLADLAVAFNSLIKLLLGAMGAVALFYFVWGGTRWLVSGGSAERVNQGKTIMVNTVFALILAFGSYLIITFFVNDVLNVTSSDKDYNFDFTIGEGPFESCQDVSRGGSCGNNKQCTGEISSGPYTNLSKKCLDICWVEALTVSGDTQVGKCVASLNGLTQVPGTGLCSGQQICAFLPAL